MLNGGLNSEQFTDALEVGRSLLADGATKFGDWVAKMGECAGEGIYPFALKIWDAIQAKNPKCAAATDVGQVGAADIPNREFPPPSEPATDVRPLAAGTEEALAGYIYDLDSVMALADSPGAIDIERESPEFEWSVPLKRSQPDPDDVGMATAQVEAWLRINVSDPKHTGAALQYLLVTRRDILSWLENQIAIFPESEDYEDRYWRVRWYSDDIEPQIEAIQRLLEARRQESDRCATVVKQPQSVEPKPGSMVRRPSARDEKRGSAAGEEHEPPKAPVDFVVDLNVLKKALKQFSAGKGRGKQVRADYVDVNAAATEVSLVTTGASTAFPAEVKSGGYARVPGPIFDVLTREPQKLGGKRISFLIQAGKIKAGSVTFKHSGITLELIGARIADLPINASLLETLGLLVRFGGQELAGSGLWKRMMQAQGQAGELVDRATKALEPLGISREALSEFVWDQIKKRQGSRGCS